jgi:hypothetical protein
MFRIFISYMLSKTLCENLSILNFFIAAFKYLFETIKEI